LSTASAGGAVKVKAYAGAGKTSTLRMAAELRPRRGLYLAFNKEIANEAARKFPEHALPHGVLLAAAARGRRSPASSRTRASRPTNWRALWLGSCACRRRSARIWA
jgi:hypothetical protein